VTAGDPGVVALDAPDLPGPREAAPAASGLGPA